RTERAVQAPRGQVLRPGEARGDGFRRAKHVRFRARPQATAQRSGPISPEGRTASDSESVGTPRGLSRGTGLRAGASKPGTGNAGRMTDGAPGDSSKVSGKAPETRAGHVSLSRSPFVALRPQEATAPTLEADPTAQDLCQDRKRAHGQPSSQDS